MPPRRSKSTPPSASILSVETVVDGSDHDDEKTPISGKGLTTPRPTVDDGAGKDDNADATPVGSNVEADESDAVAAAEMPKNKQPASVEPLGDLEQHEDEVPRGDDTAEKDAASAKEVQQTATNSNNWYIVPTSSSKSTAQSSAGVSSGKKQQQLMKLPMTISKYIGSSDSEEDTSRKDPDHNPYAHMNDGTLSSRRKEAIETIEKGHDKLKHEKNPLVMLREIRTGAEVNNALVPLANKCTQIFGVIEELKDSYPDFFKFDVGYHTMPKFLQVIHEFYVEIPEKIHEAEKARAKIDIEQDLRDRQGVERFLNKRRRARKAQEDNAKKDSKLRKRPRTATSRASIDENEFAIVEEDAKELFEQNRDFFERYDFFKPEEIDPRGFKRDKVTKWVVAKLISALKNSDTPE